MSSRRWRESGGGSLIRLAAHPVGAALYLKRVEGVRRNGEPIVPVAVTAEIGPLGTVAAANGTVARQILHEWEDVEDWGSILLTFSDGTKAVLGGSDVQLGGLQSYLDLTLSNGLITCRLSPTDLCRAYAPDEITWGAVI